MKKTSIFLTLMTAGAMAFAQSPRLSLYEEFTGENCAPCAATNPGLQTVLNANTSKIVAIKWQVPIPSAPSAAWSLYQTNKNEINWRHLGWNGSYSSTVIAAPTSTGGYGYPTAANAAASGTAITSGVNSAPSGRIDGQHQWTFGATGDHPAYLTSTHISNAQAITSPFTVNMTRAWDPTYTAVTVTVDITASQTFTATGNLVFRLVMVEQTINFATAPGSNGEKDFYNAARASFPDLKNGTALPGTWTLGQNMTFTVNCPLPAYIVDKSQVNFVGFIQDDGTRMVHQAARTTTMAIPNDAKALAVQLNDLVCTANFTPMVTVYNNGNNAITDFTVTPKLDATTGANVVWTGTLAPGASTTIPLNSIAGATSGNHVYSYTITNVSGGDYAMANNTSSKKFIVSPNIYMPPVAENFTATATIPANWSLYNADGGAYTWARQGTANAYVASPAGAMRYYFWNNSVAGDVDDLYLPPTDLTAIGNPVLSWDYAYRQYNSSYSDGLDVQVSDDCGATWTTIFSKSGPTLATAAAGTGDYVPAVTDWTNTAIPLPTMANKPSVLVRFRAINDYGNNLWIDNVNLGSPLSINKNTAANVAFEVYPNPAKNETNIKISSVTSADATITVLNTLGQVVYTKQTTLSFGVNTIQVDTKDLADGVYNIVVNTGSSSSVKKLTVTK